MRNRKSNTFVIYIYIDKYIKWIRYYYLVYGYYILLLFIQEYVNSFKKFTQFTRILELVPQNIVLCVTALTITINMIYKHSIRLDLNMDWPLLWLAEYYPE